MRQIEHYLRRLSRLEAERKRGWEAHWRDLARHFLPRRARFLDSGEESNSGESRNFLEDGTGILALRSLANGLHSGLTSPARPWFALSLHNRALAESWAVKLWLEDTYQKMNAAFAQSNFYDQVHVLYSELACFGTGVLLLEADAKSLLRCRALTVGEYALDAGADGRVDTLYRRLRMTPRQIVEAWPDTCPQEIRDMARQEQGRWLTLLHAIEPRRDAQGKGAALGAASRPWASVYLILEGARRTLLEESGYYEFPALAPRWTVTASDIYGQSPAMDALPDCRQLQRLALDGRLSLEMEVAPPMLVSQSGLVGALDLSPRALNYSASIQGGQELVRPLYQTRANLEALACEKEGLREQIQRHFHNDLFLMLAKSPRPMTATEVAERNGEKLLMLGPVLDRLRSELFQPLIERLYGIMDRAGLIAPLPPELLAEPVKVEFISILAQAQKQAGLSAVDQLVERLGRLAQLKGPAVLDMLNAEALADAWAELLGAAPRLLRPASELLAQGRAECMEQPSSDAFASRRV